MQRLRLSTVHGEGVEDLCRKPLYRTLLSRGLFERAVVLCRRSEPGYRVEVLSW